MRLSKTLVKSFLPKRPKNAHKGTFGRVLVVAGSANMAGAGVLCARGVLQTGAGLVCLALPQSRQCVAAAAVPESLTLALPETNGVISTRAVSVLVKFIQEFQPSIVLLGSGLSKAPFILPFLKKLTVPVVLDADALNALAWQKNWPTCLPKNVPLICTPHPGEMARLLGMKVGQSESARTECAQHLSQLTGGVSVLKGFHTVITNGHTIYINPTGGPMLSKAGSGDTLGGFIAGLWAQIGQADGFDNQSALRAAATGVYLHGLCGQLAAKQLTERCVLASDVAAQLPDAMKQVLR